MPNASIQLGLYHMHFKPLKNDDIILLLFFQPSHNTFNLKYLKDLCQSLIVKDKTSYARPHILFNSCRTKQILTVQTVIIPELINVQAKDPRKIVLMGLV